MRSEVLSIRSRALKPIETRIEIAENEIVTQEKTLEGLNREMQEASQSGDGQKISEISQAIHRCQTIIDNAFDALEDLTASLKAQEERFQKQLAELENQTS